MAMQDFTCEILAIQLRCGVLKRLPPPKPKCFATHRDNTLCKRIDLETSYLDSVLFWRITREKSWGRLFFFFFFSQMLIAGSTTTDIITGLESKLWLMKLKLSEKAACHFKTNHEPLIKKKAHITKFEKRKNKRKQSNKLKGPTLCPLSFFIPDSSGAAS